MGGTSCVPGGSALRTPAPHDNTFTGPRHPYPEKDISGLPLRHGGRLATLHPSFINGGHFGSPSSSSPGSSSVPLLWCPHGRVSILFLSFSSSSWGVVCGGGTFPQGHGGYPRGTTSVAPSLAVCGLSRRITNPLLDLTLPCHFPALVEAYLLLSRTTPGLG